MSKMNLVSTQLDNPWGFMYLGLSFTYGTTASSSSLLLIEKKPYPFQDYGVLGDMTQLAGTELWQKSTLSFLNS